MPKTDSTPAAAEVKPHPLTVDSWRTSSESDPYLSASIAAVTRAAISVTTLSRLVHNSLCEPDMSGAEPLDTKTLLAITGALEVIGDAILNRTEEMRESAASFAKLEARRG